LQTRYASSRVLLVLNLLVADRHHIRTQVVLEAIFIRLAANTKRHGVSSRSAKMQTACAPARVTAQSSFRGHEAREAGRMWRLGCAAHRMRSTPTSDRSKSVAHLLPCARPGPAFGTCHAWSHPPMTRRPAIAMARSSPSGAELDAYVRRCFKRTFYPYKTPSCLRDLRQSCTALFSLCYTIPKVYSVGPDSVSRNWIPIFQNPSPCHFYFDVCDSESSY
jgi:hypothetical protein